MRAGDVLVAHKHRASWHAVPQPSVLPARRERDTQLSYRMTKPVPVKRHRGEPGHTTVLKSQGQDTRANRTQHTTSSSTQPHANSTVAACSCLPDAAPTSGGPGAVAITVTTTALDRVSGVVCGDACVPGFGCGLARESVGRVGLEVGLEVSLEVGSCASLVCAPPVSLNQTRVIKSHAPRQKSYLCRCLCLSRVTLWLPVFLNRYR